MATYVRQNSNRQTIKEYTYAVVTATDDFSNDGLALLFIKTGAGASGNMTVKSVPCPDGRIKDIVKAMEATKFYVVGPFEPRLFNNANGKVDVEFASITDIDAAVIGLV
jgi:hypothetical protein